MTNIKQKALVKAIQRRALRSQVIKDSDAYNALYRQLQEAMEAAWGEAMTAGIADALDRLRDLGAGAFTRQDGAAILRVLEASIGEDAIKAVMRQPVMTLSDALFRVGASEVSQSLDVSIAFMRPDLDALDVLKTGNLYWIGRSWNIKTQNLMAAALEDYFEKGMTREGLIERFATDFAGLTQRGQAYWAMLADHTATKTREIGRVTGYERAGVSYVQVRANLDTRTTQICRQMHGRVIAVTALRAQADEYLEAVSVRNEAKAKAAWQMHGQSAALEGVPTSKLGRDTASPPYHFRCRTITVAYFGDKADALGEMTRKVQDREPLNRKELEAIVAQAKGAKWPHQKVARGHYRKHQKRLGIDTQADYNQSAIDLIRRGDRDVYVSMRKGALNATFVKKQKNAANNNDGYILTSVDLVENKITSHHWRDKLKTSRDDVPAKKQNARGIMKWLIKSKA